MKFRILFFLNIGILVCVFGLGSGCAIGRRTPDGSTVEAGRTMSGFLPEDSVFRRSRFNNTNAATVSNQGKAGRSLLEARMTLFGGHDEYGPSLLGSMRMLAAGSPSSPLGFTQYNDTASGQSETSSPSTINTSLSGRGGGSSTSQ